MFCWNSSTLRGRGLLICNVWPEVLCLFWLPNMTLSLSTDTNPLQSRLPLYNQSAISWNKLNVHYSMQWSFTHTRTHKHRGLIQQGNVTWMLVSDPRLSRENQHTRHDIRCNSRYLPSPRPMLGQIQKYMLNNNRGSLSMQCRVTTQIIDMDSYAAKSAISCLHHGTGSSQLPSSFPQSRDFQTHILLTYGALSWATPLEKKSKVIHAHTGCGI